jgi:hypothetical protein
VVIYHPAAFSLIQSMLKEVEEDVEYHVYQTLQTETTDKRIITDRREAERLFADGWIVYEVKQRAAQADWITISTTTYYEWH